MPASVQSKLLDVDLDAVNCGTSDGSGPGTPKLRSENATLGRCGEVTRCVICAAAGSPACCAETYWVLPLGVVFSTPYTYSEGRPAALAATGATRAAKARPRTMRLNLKCLRNIVSLLRNFHDRLRIEERGNRQSTCRPSPPIVE